MKWITDPASRLMWHLHSVDQSRHEFHYGDMLGLLVCHMRESKVLGTGHKSDTRRTYGANFYKHLIFRTRAIVPLLLALVQWCACRKACLALSLEIRKLNVSTMRVVCLVLDVLHCSCNQFLCATTTIKGAGSCVLVLRGWRATMVRKTLQ